MKRRCNSRQLSKEYGMNFSRQNTRNQMKYSCHPSGQGEIGNYEDMLQYRR